MYSLMPPPPPDIAASGHSWLPACGKSSVGGSRYASWPKNGPGEATWAWAFSDLPVAGTALGGTGSDNTRPAR